MKKRILRILACLLALAALPAALGGFAFALPPQYGDTFLGELPYKCAALAAAEGRRVIVAGGSGVAFGLRSDLLEGELPGYAVVNFGMYAGLGSTVMLELAEEELRPGDVVVFSPEQSGQTLSRYLSGEAMWQAADGHTDLLGRLDRESWGTLAGSFPYFAAQKACFCRDGDPPAGDGVYARSSFNAWGDIDYPDRGNNVMAGGMDPDLPIVFDETLPTGEFLDYVKDYAARCRAKGVAFYYRFCPMNAAAISPVQRERAAEYQSWLAQRLDCPILGDVEDAILDEGWFYDTNFHLNSAGAVVNTARLAAELKAALGLEGEVSIPLPAMPGRGEDAPAAGDNSDDGCFTYESAGEGLRVTGLTAAGAARERLTVPASHEGRAVVSLAPETFAGNTVLREIVLQDNLRGIEDGSFNGCTALERLVIQNTSPSSCPVGAGLLEGTGTAVYVPQESYGAYVTNYFWAPHAGRVRGEEMDLPGSAPTPTPTTAPSYGPAIRYEGNGGTLRLDGGTFTDAALDNAHLRANTLQGARYFVREGYALLGWNTAADGSGTAVGLGSRVEKTAGLTLYAQWAAENGAEDFTWEDRDGSAWITGYRGTGRTCVIPAALGGLTVRGIAAGAFRGVELDQLVLPAGLYTVEHGAFGDCTVAELTFFDSLRTVYEDSFSGCTLTTLHVNADTAPVYSGSYFGAFADKYDRLLSLAGEKKLVLFSGSSGRYGYNSPTLERAYPAYRVVNMGVYAYTNALPQLELLRRHLEPGDVVLHAPEFDAIGEQFCATNRLDPQFWAMMEANYDAAAELDLGEYSNVFGSLGEYLAIRVGLESGSYSDSPAGYDDDGNYYPFATYNQYGDFILPRPNEEKEGLKNQNIADYTLKSFPAAYVDSLNAEYRRLTADGIRVYFSYAPRNLYSLTAESTPQARAEVEAMLEEKICVPVISKMEDYFWSGVYFYLIDNHLTDEGAAMRTERIIEDLRPWLE